MHLFSLPAIPLLPRARAAANCTVRTHHMALNRRVGGDAFRLAAVEADSQPRNKADRPSPSSSTDMKCVRDRERKNVNRTLYTS